MLTARSFLRALSTSSIEHLEPRRLLAATPLSIVVDPTQWGISTKYIGAVEGSARFNINDLKDLGFNTYRVYGGMSRWEPRDDDGVYGSPSVAQIKADPNTINWQYWDNAMTNPPAGSDYSWSGQGWQGNARTIFQQLKTAGIRPVLTLRNHDNNGNPKWIPATITTEADRNEWFEHVFATVYWLNVRNDYQVNDFEIHNEPNNKPQGWTGTQAQYFDFARITSDAIKYVYDNYLPGRTPHIHAPKTTTGSTWPEAALSQIGDTFDTVNVHNYDADITMYTRQVHGYMNAAGKPDAELWLGEWGTYQNNYSNVPFDVTLIQNLIRGSRPGDDYVTGSHVFSLYDWGTGKKSFKGLVSGTGAKTPAYYAMRLGTRALQGGRATYRAAETANDVIAIGTKDAAGNFYLLVTNRGKTTFNVDADLSAHLTSSTGTMWQFSSTVNDAVVGSPKVIAGHTTFSVPQYSAFLLKFPGASSAPIAIPAATPFLPPPVATPVVIPPTHTVPLTHAIGEVDPNAAGLYYDDMADYTA